jgi:hypothetical protein
VVDAVRDVVWRTDHTERRKMTPADLYGRVKMRAHPDRAARPGVSDGAVDRSTKHLMHGARRSKGTRTTNPGADGVRAAGLLNQQFRAEEPNRIWVDRFTFVRSSPVGMGQLPARSA